MGKYASNDLVIQFDNSGGALQDMTQYVLELNGIDIEGLMAESHSFGDAWFEALWTGIRKMAEIVLKGFYDDTATTGPDAIFNAVGNLNVTRTFKVTWGSTKTTSVETYIKNYRRLPTRGEISKYEVVLVPTGAPTET